MTKFDRNVRFFAVPFKSNVTLTWNANATLGYSLQEPEKAIKQKRSAVARL